MNTPSSTSDEVAARDVAARRKGVRRTALLVGAIAVAIYIAFILSGVVAA